MNKLFFILALIMLISGCSTKPQRVIVKETEYVYTSIPDASLRKCSVTKPPAKQEYLDTDDIGRENLLRSTIVKLYGDLDKCNSQIQSIKDFDTEQQKIIKKKKNKP